ncbi:MAG: hypothetical protein R3357_09740, partial [Burkholderiales bacterium]|nr:hypothetical protein [Burkholderiales bacterium]
MSGILAWRMRHVGRLARTHSARMPRARLWTPTGRPSLLRLSAERLRRPALAPLHTGGSQPWALELQPDELALWVVDRTDATVTIFDTDTLSGTLHDVLSTVALPGGSQPMGIAFSPDGTRALVAGANEVFVIDTAIAVVDPG